MLSPAVARRVDEDDSARAGDGLRVDEHAARAHVAEIDHLPRSVRVDAPEMVIMDLAAVHVFPPLKDHSSVMKYTRGVVMFDVS